MEGFYSCPICSSRLQVNGPRYTIDQLFSLWKPLQFSAETIAEHKNQSLYTQMYSCPTCCFDIFLPQIIGTPAFYKELLADKDHNYYEKNKWEFDELLGDLQKGDSILEIGCGPGNFLELAKTKISDIWGIEYNEDAVECACQKGLKVINIRSEDLLKRGSFDIVASFHVLEHVSDPYIFIKTMLSWVKFGGKICISVPNQDGPIKFINPCHMNMPPHHATRWHEKTFKILAQRLNLKIEKIAYEPLLLINHSYYSYYWVNSTIKGNSIGSRTIRSILKCGLGSFFKGLSLFQQYFPLLKGQSIYLLISNAEDNLCAE